MIPDHEHIEEFLSACPDWREHAKRLPGGGRELDRDATWEPWDKMSRNRHEPQGDHPTGNRRGEGKAAGGTWWG
ncbi:MAG TPA: hypothetical protein VH475_01005 [Tepidisphaeraceae bacterium]|jgi:hypothetical protein